MKAEAEFWSGTRRESSISGDMPPEASAKALFESLWSKSYGCESGKLLSVSDKTTPAPEPLHFRADDSHSAEVYLGCSRQRQVFR